VEIGRGKRREGNDVKGMKGREGGGRVRGTEWKGGEGKERRGGLGLDIYPGTPSS